MPNRTRGRNLRFCVFALHSCEVGPFRVVATVHRERVDPETVVTVSVSDGELIRLCIITIGDRVLYNKTAEPLVALRTGLCVPSTA